MKERPILFGGDMVKAILDGRKTQTRRTHGLSQFNGQPDRWRREGDTMAFDGGFEYAPVPKCPYGKPGDVLWVRETWMVDYNDWPGGMREFGIAYRAEDKEHFAGTPYQPTHRCGHHTPQKQLELSYKFDGKWKPSIHMPRWASRISLLVKDVRVERLQDITPADCEAEGMLTDIQATSLDTEDFKMREQALYFNMAKLWDFINGKKHPWSENPWVWVIKFEKAVI